LQIQSEREETKVNAYQVNVSGIKEESPKNRGKKRTSMSLLQNKPTLEENVEKGVRNPNQMTTDHLTVERVEIRIELTGRLVNRITRNYERMWKENHRRNQTRKHAIISKEDSVDE
jgi:hypothetical protein